MKTLSIIISLTCIASLAIIVACESNVQPPETEMSSDSSSQTVTPTSPYARALSISLAEISPRNEAGLHNLYVLSDQVISGSEPSGEAAFAELARRGVKVILSVDGKIPDVESAQKHGMRYVHSPIEYSGMNADEIGRIAKTFRELEGPFYVHCFHGRHRGPAAAAIGRIVVDGASRDQALAEMRQWCGTSGKYDGLYQTVAESKIPNAEQSAALRWDFPSRQVLDGFRAIMVGVPRAHDHLKALKKHSWRADPMHPDVDARNEAEKLRDLFESSQKLPDAATEDEDFRAWLQTSVDASRELVELFKAAPVQGLNAAQLLRAKSVLDRITSTCTACHAIYRD